MLIDSHCHLDFPEFEAELDAVVARARAAGIDRIVTISTRVHRHAQVLAIAERFPDVFCSVGTHPHNAQEETDITAAELVRRAAHPKVVAIGEAGLDYHYDFSPRAAQEHGFRTHIAAARATGLPLVIHAREADADIARILEEEMEKGAFPAVLHCFTGSRDLAQRAVALGCYVSFTGILTFKKSDELRAIAAELPQDRIFIETDAPYLAPGRFRGKRNEPAYVVEIAQALAEVRGVASRGHCPADQREFLPPVRQGSTHQRRGCMTLTATILGCGSSAGVPRPALGWGACDPKNPKNRRRRCSLLVEQRTRHGVTRILVDTSPDLREQLLAADVDWLDAVLFTHEHADHTHGIDDLRSLVIHRRRLIDVYVDERTSRTLHARFGYCFAQPPGSEYPPLSDRAPDGRGPDAEHRRGGRFDPGAPVPAGTRRHPVAWGSALDLSPIPATSAACPPKVSRRSRGSTCGSSMRCATGRTPAT